MPVDLAVIILNYRTPALTADCLASLAPEVDAGTQVIVVDNASGDGSVERLEAIVGERGWSSWARILASPVNGGFAAGNNLGIRAVDAAAYLLLNSDTLVRPGALRSLREAMAAHPEAGLIGSGLLTASGARDYSAFRDPSPVSELLRGADNGAVTRALRRFDIVIPIPDRPAEVEWVGFACVLVRREVVERVGLLDDGFFMYFEDVDYCRRVRAAGWKVLYWPHSAVVHLQGASSQVTEEASRRRRAPRYYYAARARYFAKFYGRPGLWAANALWLLGRAIAAPRQLLGRDPTHREGEARDIWINSANPLRPGPGPTP